jgi:hypothetical protein
MKINTERNKLGGRKQKDKYRGIKEKQTQKERKERNEGGREKLLAAAYSV